MLSQWRASLNHIISCIRSVESQAHSCNRSPGQRWGCVVIWYTRYPTADLSLNPSRSHEKRYIMRELIYILYCGRCHNLSSHKPYRRVTLAAMKWKLTLGAPGVVWIIVILFVYIVIKSPADGVFVL